MTTDLQQAERLLRALGGRFTFQTFDDDKARKKARDDAARAAGRKPRDPFARKLYGTLADHADRLGDLNARGAGVFVMVNEGDGKGRSIGNVQRIRAYFADFDGTEPPDAATVPLRPHAIIESSRGRWHWYWWIDGAPLATFAAVQTAIAERFGSDPSMKDLPRVMRLPGFLHRKRDPFPTRIVELRDGPRFTHADFVQAFGIDLSAPVQPSRANRPTVARDATVTPLPTAQRHRRTLPATIPEGERNATLLSLAAGLVRKGLDLLAVTRRLQRMNAEHCDPPLSLTEVDTIAMRAIGYGSDGYRLLTDALFDELRRSGLPLPVRWIVLTALRRFDGYNSGNIALTHADCRDIPGCRDERTFLLYRARAVGAGFLIVAKRATMTRNGKTPTLYAIPPRYLPSLTGQNTRLAHTGQNTRSYIDKQIGDAVAVVGGMDARLQAPAQTSQRGTNG